MLSALIASDLSLVKSKTIDLDASSAAQPMILSSFSAFTKLLLSNLTRLALDFAHSKHQLRAALDSEEMLRLLSFCASSSRITMSGTTIPKEGLIWVLSRVCSDLRVSNFDMRTLVSRTRTLDGKES